MSIKRATAARCATEIQTGVSALKALMDAAWYVMREHKGTGTNDETESRARWKLACSRYQTAVEDCNIAYRQAL